MRALLVGLFAFALVTQAAAAAMQGESTPAPRKANVERPALTLDQQLERKLAALRKYRGTVRFFENHRIVARLGRRAGESEVRRSRTPVRACDSSRRASPPSARRSVRATGGGWPSCPRARRSAPCSERTARRLSPSRGASPGSARQPRTASTAASSRWARTSEAFSATARSAHDQSLAAHRYFVRSGRDWSPWACRWAAY